VDTGLERLGHAHHVRTQNNVKEYDGPVPMAQRRAEPQPMKAWA
jgi:hypothetical protein